MLRQDGRAPERAVEGSPGLAGVDGRKPHAGSIAALSVKRCDVQDSALPYPKTGTPRTLTPIFGIGHLNQQA